MMRESRKRGTFIGLGSFALVVAVLVTWLLGAPASVRDEAGRTGPGPRIGASPPMPEPVDRSRVEEVEVEPVARDLEIPWDLAFAPDERMFFTERPGRVRTLRSGDEPETWLDLEAAVHRGEGGALGVALHPRFESEPFVYVMYTTQIGDELVNRVSRFRDHEGRGRDEQVVIHGIPGEEIHNGGALVFGRDGMLYIGTGDAREPSSAQDPRTLAGKVLRVRPDGSLPPDNPFEESPVWAYGFRNVSGLAFRPGTDELFAASHGPSGEFPGITARDTVYRVRRGGNHGWPLVVGIPEREDIEAPILYYPDEAVPPGGLTFYDGAMFPEWQGELFMTSLGALHLQKVTLEGDRPVALERWWRGTYGRLRAVAVGPDGALYVSTSNRDGRAPREYEGADIIYRVARRSSRPL